MVAVGFLTATLKKCFFIMLWLNSFKGGLVSTFDIKLVCLIHMRKASGVKRQIV